MSANCSIFGSWRPLPEAPNFAPKALHETLEGGQAVRWTKNLDYYEGRWSDQVVRLRLDEKGLSFAAPEGTDPTQSLRQYLALDTDFEKLTDQLPWRSDPVLQQSIEAFRGLRILRQPFGETLFAFLCSSTKQIPQIKAINEAVAADLGQALHDGSHALPTWSRIAEAGEARLRAAKLGYRAKYIHQTAEFLQNSPNWLDETATLETSLARERLQQLPGVGRKIADCVLLFSLGRLDAFPIDTWVHKILTRAYGLEGWSTQQLLDFARAHFGPSAGLAQQYLFAAARAGLIAKTPKALT